MSSLSSNPKAFVISASKGQKTGFLRFMSYVDNKDSIRYKMVFVKSKTMASKFLNFDTTKERALRYMKILGLSEVRVIDCITGRNYNVRDKKRTEEP